MPHGIRVDGLRPVADAVPPLHALCFIHGLHDVRIGGTQQPNLGAHNGLQALRVLRARYWIGTHDEVKRGGGFTSWLLRRKVVSVEEALKEEERKRAEVEGH